MVPVGLTEIPQAVVNVRRAVVRVYVYTEGKKRSIGSGVHIGDGLILTAAHVVEGGKRFMVVALGQSKYTAGRLLAVDRQLDIALLQLESPPPTSASLATEAPLRGSHVISVGFGRNLKLGWNLGRLESFTGRGEATGMFWSGASRDGDSGGPAFNVRGLVVGVLSGTDGRRTHGTHVGKLWAFCRPWCKKKPAPKPDQRDDLRKQIAELRAEIERLKKEKGPKGDPGEVDYKRIVDELAKRAITVQIVDKDGTVKQQQQVYLGGTLRLRHRPIGE